LSRAIWFWERFADTPLGQGLLVKSFVYGAWPTFFRVQVVDPDVLRKSSIGGVRRGKYYAVVFFPAHDQLSAMSSLTVRLIQGHQCLAFSQQYFKGGSRMA
jgi:hypothetical protein